MNRYVIFSAIKRSPTSNTGYIESEGMNLGSAMVARNASDTANVMSTVATSSRFRRNPSGTHSGQSMSMSSSSSPPSPSPPPPALASSAGAGVAGSRARANRESEARGRHRARGATTREVGGDPRVGSSRLRENEGDAAGAVGVAARSETRGRPTRDRARGDDDAERRRGERCHRGRAVREQIMSHAPTLS